MGSRAFSTIHEGVFRFGTCRAKNTATLVGLDAMINFLFNGAPNYADWYIGLIDETSYTATSFNDTEASHAGWSEFVDYTYGGVDQRIGPLAGNYSRSFQLGLTGFLPTLEVKATAAGVIKGLFLSTSPTKNGGSGLLVAVAQLFPASPVANNQVMEMSYGYQVNGVVALENLPL